MNHWPQWKYKNISLIFLGVLIAFTLSRVSVFHEFLINLGEFGYISAFIAGALFVSTLTVATGALILFTLAESMPPLAIALIAGLGAATGDLLIFRLVKNHIVKEFGEFCRDNHLNSKYFSKLMHTKYFNWMLPVIGALIIASPFPDEVGISLMGISSMKTFNFVIISFLLNSIGIFLVITAFVIINP